MRIPHTRREPVLIGNDLCTGGLSLCSPLTRDLRESYYSLMKRASITYTKNHLSRLLGMVREGETILVVDRRVPVARIQPIDRSGLVQEDRLASLVEKGVVTTPRCRLDLDEFLAEDLSETETGASVVDAVLQEREEGR